MIAYDEAIPSNSVAASYRLCTRNRRKYSKTDQTARVWLLGQTSFVPAGEKLIYVSLAITI